MRGEGGDNDQIIKTHTPEPELGPIFCQNPDSDGQLAGNLEPKTGSKPESTEQMTEQTAENGLKTSQKLDDNEPAMDV